MSTSTRLAIAKSFAKFDLPIDDRFVRVLFKIHLNLDFLNDLGCYIAEESAKPHEEEWLMTFGSLLDITF